MALQTRTDNKMKNEKQKKHHTVGTFTKSNRKIVERSKHDTSDTNTF